MARGPLAWLFWRVVDDFDYFLTLTRLRILDALARPEPETLADRLRKRDRARIEKAFSGLCSEEPGAKISNRVDRASTEE